MTQALNILFNNPTLLAHPNCSQTIAGSNKEFRNHNVAAYKALGGDAKAAYKGSSHKVAAKWNDDPAPYIHSPDYVCIACGGSGGHDTTTFDGVALSRQAAKTQAAKTQAAKVETVQVETASQTGQAFDALQFLIECRDFKRGKWLTKHNGKSIHAKHTAARHLREQNGMGKDASIERVKELSREVECMDTKPVETEAEKAEMEADMVARISGKPQTKPAPKAQTKPVPQADGSIKVMDAELFTRLANEVSVEMMTVEIEVETITVNGVVFRCS